MAIEMKPTEHYFHTLLFIMLYKVDLCFLSRGVARISQRTGEGGSHYCIKVRVLTRFVKGVHGHPKIPSP